MRSHGRPCEMRLKVGNASLRRAWSPSTASLHGSIQFACLQTLLSHLGEMTTSFLVCCILVCISFGRTIKEPSCERRNRALATHPLPALKHFLSRSPTFCTRPPWPSRHPSPTTHPN